MPDADLTGRHPAVLAVLQHFTFEHLPPHLQAVSRPCAELAYAMVAACPDDPQLTVGLQGLLAAKDAFVRAALAGARS
jgi:hypothetical protein